MGRTDPRSGRARRSLVLVVVMVLALAACGGDDDGGEDDAADEASFCRLARGNDPVDEARASVLVRMEDLAPGEVSDDIAVLRELAEEVEELAADDPSSLELEFERRFDEEFVAARRAVAAFVAEECPAPTTTTSSTATTETSDGTSSTIPSKPSSGDDED